MDATAMTRLLDSASGGDPAALQRDLRAALGASLDAEELGERAREAAACLRSPGSRLAAAARQLLAPTDEAEGARPTPGEWLVLDELVAHVSDSLEAIEGGEADEEAPAEDEDALWETLAAFARRSTQEMGRGDRQKRWTQWCERLLRAVFAGSEDGGRGADDAPVGSEQKQRRRRSKQRTEAIRAVARALLSLHESMAGSGSSRSDDLKVATLVWKVRATAVDDAMAVELTTCMRSQNLTKLAKSHPVALFDEEPPPMDSDGETPTADASGPLNAETVMNCVVSAMEDAGGQLIAGLATVGSALKALRLYWRAFQGHFLHLGSAFSSSTLENCVLATVNTASTLVYVTTILPNAEQGSKTQLPSKTVRDARSILELVMSFPTKLTSSDDPAPSLLPETGLAIVQTLLWYPADDMARAIAQRQEESRPESMRDGCGATTIRDERGLELATRWAHWCLLVTTAATNRPDEVDRGDADRSLLSSNAPDIAGLVDKLFDRYLEDCAIRSSAVMISSVTPLAVDALLELLSLFADFEQLQLVLLKHAVYPCVDRRHLSWELWKELVCYCWEEDTALAALETLLLLTEQEPEADAARDAARESHQTQTPLASHVGDDITRLVAFMYAEMPLSLKEVCVQRVTAAIQHICSDGPFHAFSTTIAARLVLLDQLAATRFLRDYDHPDKEQWIATQLPMCFECCGTIIDLLGGTSAAPDLRSDPGKFAGALRVLDVCLLLLKSIYDDNDSREDTTDLMELSRILLPVLTEVLSLLAKSPHQPNPVESASARQAVGSAASHPATSTRLSAPRILRTCLYLLGKMGALVKRNHSNQYVQAVKNLIDIVDNDGLVDLQRDRNAIGSIAWFAKTTLFDVQAAESDIPVVAELLAMLFQRLCTSELVAMTSPLGHVIVQAVYGVLASSNVARSLNIPASIPLVSARRDVRHLALLHKDAENDAGMLERAATAAVLSSDSIEARARHATRCRRVFRKWFPSGNDDDDMETIEGDTLVSSNGDETGSFAATETKRRAGEQNGEIALVKKRQKLEHLVSRCRQVIDNCGSSADNVSDQELNEATRMLEVIIAKALSF